jgi:hypothetical protein
MCGEGEASGHSIDRLAARNCFGRVHDAKDGNVVSVSEALQPGKHAAHGGHLVCVHLIAEKALSGSIMIKLTSPICSIFSPSCSRSLCKLGEACRHGRA